MDKQEKPDLSFSDWRTARRTSVRLAKEELIKTSLFGSGEGFPFVLEPNIDHFNLVDWLRTNCEFVQTSLLKYGALLFRGFDIRSVNQFEKVAKSISPDLLDYNERAAPRTEELMILPEEFDLPGRARESGIYYLGAGVDLERVEEPFDWTGIDPERPLVYCALGSQNHLRQDASRRFYRVVLDTANEHSDWQFIIALGKTIDGRDFGVPSDNVALRNWVPQLEVLSRATIMINHAGFGTIKECILQGVPMLVFPLLRNRDHGACADRVVYHGLGLRGDIETVSPTELGSLIEQVIADQPFRQCIQLMRAKFKQHDRLDIGVKLIEGVASRSSGSASYENCG